MRWREDARKWEIRWRENGRHRSKSFSRKADAAAFEAKVTLARERGEVLDLDRGKESLAEFIESWWVGYAIPELADKTRKDYARAWEKHARKKLGGYRLRDVTPAVLADHKAQLLASGLGEPSVGEVLTLLSGVLRCAVVWGRIASNPMQEIRIPQPKRVRLVRPLTPNQVEALRVHFAANDDLLSATLVAVLAYGGLRPGEARGLRWGDIGERTIRVERAVAGSALKATKTEELRTVRLLSPLARNLEAWREHQEQPADGDLVFPAARGGLWTENVYRKWRSGRFKPAVDGLGLIGCRPYDLRHSFASLLIHEGATVPELARQMGNAPSVALDTYAHVFEERDPERARDPVAAIEAAVAEFDVRDEYAEGESPEAAESRQPTSDQEALLRTRTADPLLTITFWG